MRNHERGHSTENNIKENRRKFQLLHKSQDGVELQITTWEGLIRPKWSSIHVVVLRELDNTRKLFITKRSHAKGKY